jgi:hypothetical protein
MCNRARWLACIVAVFCLNTLMVGPSFAASVSTIAGSFSTIDPTKGLDFASFTFLNGLTLDNPDVAGIGGHTWQSVHFDLGSGTSTGGPVTITDRAIEGLAQINIVGIAIWNITNPGQIDIFSSTNATATADLTLVPGSVDPFFMGVDFTSMATAKVEIQFEGIAVTDPPGQLLATWDSTQAPVTATFSIIGTNVPEPASAVLAASGAMLLAGIRLLRRRTA